MNIAITFRHITGNEVLKSYAHDKVAKLQKFLPRPMSAQVTLSLDGIDQVAEVRVLAGSASYLATEHSNDMRASIDAVHDKLTRQIQANKDPH